MKEEIEYQCILDESNVITKSQKGSDSKSTPHIIVARLNSAFAYLKSRGIKCKIFFYEATLKQAEKKKRPLLGRVRELRALLEQNEVEIITNDGTMARFAIREEIPIVTNYQFKDWVGGKTKANSTKDITTENWKAILELRVGHKFTKNKFSISGIIPFNQKSAPKLELKESQESNSLEKIQARLESVDVRMKNQTTRINEIESRLLKMSNFFEFYSAIRAKFNSSALVHCRFGDEFGQSHICLLGGTFAYMERRKFVSSIT